MSTAPTLLDAPEAAKALVRGLGGRAGEARDLTIADASTRTGLPLRDAERGLHSLVSEYRGHLRVTSEGELLFRFPHGFTKPWETRTRLRAAAGAVGRAAWGAARFVVRAWIAIVLVGYVALFLAILVGLAFARSSGSDSRDRDGGIGFGLAHVLLRVIADALFWTFHPFSPFSIAYHSGGVASPPRRRRADEPGTPFYEKVNRFFFGPTLPPEDPRALEQKILAEIRAQKGRIGLADVMRVTGLPRDEADPLMARLMLDYDGTVLVSDEGGITYRFASIRKTAAAGAASRPEPVWARPARLEPLTGNSSGSNVLIGALNGFNLFASLWALSNGLTLSKVGLLLAGVPMAKLPIGGLAVALGVVPLVFSIALFALPLARAIYRPIRERRVARENGRRAMLRAVLDGVRSGGVGEEELARAWREASGEEPDPKTLTREVVALGGDVDLDQASRGVRFRFPDLEAEAAALEAEREAASEEEARVGPVIFSSEA